MPFKVIASRAAADSAVAIFVRRRAEVFAPAPQRSDHRFAVLDAEEEAPDAPDATALPAGALPVRFENISSWSGSPKRRREKTIFSI